MRFLLIVFVLLILYISLLRREDRLDGVRELGRILETIRIIISSHWLD